MKKINYIVVIFFCILFLNSCNCNCFSCNSCKKDECQHESISWNIIQESTCTNVGIKQSICNECNTVLDTITIEKLEHVDSEWIIDKNATCENVGSKHIECIHCHQTLKTEKISKIDHNYKTTEIVNATCTESGYIKEKCIICDKEKTTTLDKLNHDLKHYDEEEPTCVNVGHKAYDACTRCSYTTYDEIEALGHNQGELVYDEDDYCLDHQVGYICCTRCEEILISFGHKYQVNTQLPTCEEDGFTKYTCSVCNDTYTITLEKTGHIEGDTKVINNPTCHTEGLEITYCKLCNDILYAHTVEKLSHNFETTTVDNKLVYTCSGCNKQIEEDIVELYNIFFETNGGDEIPSISIQNNSSIVLPTPTKEGYDFVGWYIDEDLSLLFDSKDIVEDMTLFASWSPKYYYNEASTNNILTNVEKTFEFIVETTINLNTSNIKNYITIKDISNKVISFNFKETLNNQYTIYSDYYDEGITYFVTVSDQITIVGVEGNKLQFTIKDEEHINIKFKSSVIQINLNNVYGSFEQDEKSYLILYEDLLNINDIAIIYEDDIYNVLLAFKVVKEGIYDNKYIYEITSTDENQIYDEYDIYTSEIVELDNFIINENFEEEIIEEIENSDYYRNLRKAAQAASTSDKEFYYKYNLGKIKKPKITKIDNSIFVEIVISFEYSKINKNTLKKEDKLYLKIKLTDQIFFDLDISGKNINNLVINLTTTHESSTSMYIGFESTLGTRDDDGDKEKEAEEKKEIETSIIKVFNAVFNELQSLNREKLDKVKAEKSTEFKLGKLVITKPYGQFSLDLKLKFELSFNVEAGVTTKEKTIYKTTIIKHGNNIETEKSTETSCSAKIYVKGVIRNSVSLVITADFTFFGTLSIYLENTISLYAEARGILSVQQTDNEKTFSLGGYIEIGVDIDLKGGIKIKDMLQNYKTKYKKEFDLKKWNIVIWKIGTNMLPLNYIDTTSEYEFNLNCIDSIDLNEIINTKINGQNLDTFEIYTKDTDSKFIITNKVSGVIIDNKNNLNVVMNKDDVIKVKIKVYYENIYKYVTLTIKFEHSPERCKAIQPTCEHEGSEEYVYCTTCNKVLEGTKKVIEKLPHSTGDWIIDKEATCNSEGLKYKYCSICHQNIENTIIQKTEHNYINGICEFCGKKEKNILKYQLSEDKTYYIVIVESNIDENSIIIPGIYNNLPVKVIDKSSMSGYDNLISITIPNSVTSIGDDAFSGCSSLENVYYDGTIEDWCNIKFDDYYSNPMSYANHFYIKNSNGEYEEVTEIEIPDTITKIGNYQFYGFNNVISILISNNVKSIGYQTFDKCSSLENVYYEGTIEDWCNITFNITMGNCSANPMSYANHFYQKDISQEYVEITKIEIPNTIKEIGTSQFYGFNNVIQITIPNSVTLIGKYAFAGCSSLTSIELPDSVTMVGSCAFANCSNLQYVFFHENCQMQGFSYDAFENCNKILFNELNDCLYLGSYDNPYYLLYNINSWDIESIKISNGVKNIAYGLFSDCDNLERVYYEGTIEDWCNITFSGYFGYSNPMSYANHFYIKNSNGEYEEVTEIEIPNTITKIGNYQFEGFNNVTKVTLTNSTTCVGEYAFFDCSNLSSVYYDGTIEDWCNITFSGYSGYSNPMCYATYFYMKNSEGKYEEVTEIEIPTTINSISDYRFYNFTSLKKITISNSVTSIESYAFYHCISLTEIKIPNSVNLIGYSAFSGSGITSVIFEDKSEITSILDSTFYDCRSLKNIEIPNSVKNIGDDAFYNCYRLENIYYNGTMEDWCNIIFNDSYSNPMYYANHFYIKNSNGEYEEVTEIEIPDTITKIGNYQFRGFNNVTKVTLPNSVTSIGSSAFYGCSSLEKVYYEGTIEDWCNISISSNPMSYANHFYIKNSNGQYQEVTEIEIPNTITKIGDYQFNGFNNVTKITIPNSVTSIGENAFSGCSSLISITLPFVGSTLNGEENTHFGYIFGASSYSDNSSDIPTSLKKVKITGGTSIGRYAFYKCSNLINIAIPDSVISIGDYSFSYCSSLTSIELPNSVTSIGDSAFSDCSSIINIAIPSSVTSIGRYAFSRCSSLQYSEYNNSYYLGNIENPYVVFIKVNDNQVSLININQNTNIIYNDAFEGCSSLTNIEIPNSVTSIVEGAFSGCSSLENIYYDGLIEDWCNIMFYSLSSNPMSYAKHLFIKNKTHEYEEVTEIEIPDTITQIGNYQFYSFNNLTKITISNSVTSIGESAFYNCSNLTSIEIPNSVTSIGKSTFYGCSILRSISLPFVGSALNDNENNYLGYIFGASSYSKNSKYVPTSLKEVKITGGTSIGSKAFSGCTSLISIEIPNSVTSIGEYAFEDCNSLTSIELPNSVTSIGDYAFSRCSSLTSIVIPNNVTSIGSSAFYNCKNLTKVIFEEKSKLISIGRYVFSYCSSLTSIELPNSVTSIDSSAFDYCSSLTSILVDENNYNYKSIDGNLYTKDGTKLIQYAKGKKDLLFEIPNSVTSIGDYAFSYCSSLTSIEIPNSVTRIGDSAFSYCSSLTSIEIPKSVTSIGQYAFSGCSSLISIEIPKSVTSIGSFAFAYCTSLTSIEIPNSVTSIGDDAFYKCKNLAKVTFEEKSKLTSIGRYAFYGCSSLTSIEIPNSVTSIGRYAFSECSSLTSIEIPNSVTSIGSFAFSGCSSLTNIEIPSSVTSIDSYVFFRCTNLTSIIMPNSVTSIEKCAFEGCSSLTNIKIPNSVISIGFSAFRDCKNLTKVTFEEKSKLTSIGESAFEGCSSLTSIEIPNSVISIGWYAFRYCSNLTIYCEASSKPSGWNFTWNYSDCPVIWDYKNNS